MRRQSPLEIWWVPEVTNPLIKEMMIICSGGICPFQHLAFFYISKLHPLKYLPVPLDGPKFPASHMNSLLKKMQSVSLYRLKCNKLSIFYYFTYSIFRSSWDLHLSAYDEQKISIQRCSHQIPGTWITNVGIKKFYFICNRDWAQGLNRLYEYSIIDLYPKSSSSEYEKTWGWRSRSWCEHISVRKPWAKEYR